MTISLNAPNDFDLLECVQAHGWRRLRPFGWVDSTKKLERVELTAGHPVLLRISGSPGEIVVEVDEEIPGQELVNRVITMLQLDLPIECFHDFCRQDRRLAHIPELRQGRLLRSPSVYEDVCKVIATTNTTWSQTIGMVDRLVEQFGSPNHDGDVSRRAFPRPEQIASVSLEDFSTRAKMGYRNSAVHKISVDVAEGNLDLEALRDRSIPSKNLYRFLLALPGVGPYAASCLMIYLGRYDRVNVDSWARMMVSRELGRSVTDKDVHEFFEPYAEWKALVYHFYPWQHKGPEV